MTVLDEPLVLAAHGGRMTILRSELANLLVTVTNHTRVHGDSGSDDHPSKERAP